MRNETRRAVTCQEEVADASTPAPFDINEGLRSTAVVAGSEVKGIAELELDLGTLPEIECRGAKVLSRRKVPPAVRVSGDTARSRA